MEGEGDAWEHQLLIVSVLSPTDHGHGHLHPAVSLAVVGVLSKFSSWLHSGYTQVLPSMFAEHR